MILVRPLDIPTPEQFLRLVVALSEEVTQPKRSVEASSPDLREDIVEAMTEPGPTFIFDQRIWGAVSNATAASEMHEGLLRLGVIS